jgi:hypothetical protein
VDNRWIEGVQKEDMKEVGSDVANEAPAFKAGMQEDNKGESRLVC